MQHDTEVDAPPAKTISPEVAQLLARFPKKPEAEPPAKPPAKPNVPEAPAPPRPKRKQLKKKSPREALNWFLEGGEDVYKSQYDEASEAHGILDSEIEDFKTRYLQDDVEHDFGVKKRESSWKAYNKLKKKYASRKGHQTIWKTLAEVQDVPEEVKNTALGKQLTAANQKILSEWAAKVQTLRSSCN